MSEQTSSVHNPFMLMLEPEVVIAMMEKSERLAALNRHTCRPLDRVTPSNPTGAPLIAGADADADLADLDDIDLADDAE